MPPVTLKIGMLVLCHLFFSNDKSQELIKSQVEGLSSPTSITMPHKFVGTVKGIHRAKESKTKTLNGKVFVFDEDTTILDVSSKNGDLRMYINSNACQEVGTKADYLAEVARIEKEKKFKPKVTKKLAKQKKTTKGPQENDTVNDLIVEISKSIGNKDPKKTEVKAEEELPAAPVISEDLETELPSSGDLRLNDQEKDKESKTETVEEKSEIQQSPEKESPAEKTEPSVVKEIFKDILSN